MLQEIIKRKQRVNAMDKIKDKIKIMVHKQNGEYSVVLKYALNSNLSVSIDSKLTVKTCDVFGEKHSLIYNENFLDEAVNIIKKVKECEDNRV